MLDPSGLEACGEIEVDVIQRVTVNVSLPTCSRKLNRRNLEVAPFRAWSWSNRLLPTLEDGRTYVCYPRMSVDRVLVNHGQMEQYGNCLDVVARSGAELWAHEVYCKLLGVG